MFINAAMIVSGKQAEPSTSAPVAPVETSVSPAATFVPFFSIFLKSIRLRYEMHSLIYANPRSHLLCAVFYIPS